jgi:protein phosphatase
MGTTIAVFLATDEGCAIGHVGDSRVYILRGDKVFPMTQDHSLVNEQVRAHLITEEEARKSVYRHIVTRALGMREVVEVDTQAVVLRHGDVLLLCSDGLYDLVENEMIQQVLLDSRNDLKNAAHNLIDLANAKGGEDNITVVLVQAVGPDPQD